MNKDLGMRMIELAINSEVAHYFYGLGFDNFDRLDATHYTSMVVIEWHGNWLAASFDFDDSRLAQLLCSIAPDQAAIVRFGLDNPPFRVDFQKSVPMLDVEEYLSKELCNNGKEIYCPLIVANFSSRFDAPSAG